MLIEWTQIVDCLNWAVPLISVVSLLTVSSLAGLGMLILFSAEELSPSRSTDLRSKDWGWLDTDSDGDRS